MYNEELSVGTGPWPGNIDEQSIQLFDQFKAARSVQGSYTPIIVGGTSTGTGTYSYRHGFYINMGFMWFVQFSIHWTAHTGAGGIGISLPVQANEFGKDPVVGSAFLGNCYLDANGTDAFYNLIVWNNEGYGRRQVADVVTGSSILPTGNVTTVPSKITGNVWYVSDIST